MVCYTEEFFDDVGENVRAMSHMAEAVSVLCAKAGEVVGCINFASGCSTLFHQLIFSCACTCVCRVFLCVLLGDQEGSLEVPRGAPLGRRQRNNGHDRREPHVSLPWRSLSLFPSFAVLGAGIGIDVPLSDPATTITLCLL